MSERGGGRGRGRGGGGGGGTGGRGSGGGRAGGAGRGQPLTPAGPAGGNAPVVFGSGVSFPALGSGSVRPVLGSSSSVTGGPTVGSSASSTSSPARPVATQATEVAQLEKKVQAMEVAPKGPPSSSKAVRPPLRPSFGTLGMKTVVKANHFLVKVSATDVHHYDVSITPEVRSKKVNRDIMKQLLLNYRASHLGNMMLAYDGVKGAYTAGALPFGSKEFVVKLPDPRREREFKVVMKFAAKVDVSHLRMFIERRTLDSPQEVIQALDVVLRETPSNNYEVVGRSFFHPSLGQQGTLGNGVEYWRGYYQSIRPTQMGLSLNIDISATGFYEPVGVTEFLTSHLNVRDFSRGLSDQDRIKVKKALRNVRVEVTHNDTRRRYKITNVTTQPISQLSFSNNGTDTTIVRYFKETYNCQLRHTNLPALVTGTAEKPIHLPMEVCRIVRGQKYSMKLNERQVTALLNACCQRPQDREYGIKNMVKGRNYNTDGLLTDFGFQISTELTSVNARVLEPPKIMYHNTGREALAQPTVGQWNMINKKMINGAKVNTWGCVNFSRKIPAVQFCEDLIRMCTAKGMTFSPEPFICLGNESAGQVEKTLYNIGKRCRDNSMHLQLLIIILPDISGQYGTIKRICETELDIVSQCCNPNKVLRSNQQYLENVALKINVKVGGRNSVLHEAIQRTIPFLTDRVTIIFGADVTHPQPGEDSAPSIASVVASMDWPEVTKYRSLVSAQHHRKEIIQDLYTTDESGSKPMGMIRDHLIAFRKATGRKPDRIIFYRDGVSEGQFNEVLLHEIDSIRKACVSLETNYLPPITFVVVQKRHHTRFFPVNHNDKKTTDKSGNILPGTVVDTHICHPTEFDFYLCSHAGIKGTSRPTHYHVLYDENRFDANSLQKLTYHLCYTYARCTRAVSIVPPAYYAHLAAFRARYYVEGLYSDSGSHAGRTATREQNVQPKKLPAIQAGVKEVMFYC